MGLLPRQKEYWGDCGSLGQRHMLGSLEMELNEHDTRRWAQKTPHLGVGPISTSWPLRIQSRKKG